MQSTYQKANLYIAWEPKDSKWVAQERSLVGCSGTMFGVKQYLQHSVTEILFFQNYLTYPDSRDRNLNLIEPSNRIGD